MMNMQTRFMTIAAWRWVMMVLILPAAWYSPAQSATRCPQINFKETAYDFGFQLPKKAVTLRHEFTFSNAGNQDLRILSVGNACRTQASCERTLLKPGKSSSIKVEIVLPEDYTNSEQFSRTVKITCNDTKQKEIELNLRATFKYTLDWNPNKVDLGVFSPAKDCSRNITVSSATPASYKIMECVVNPKYFAVKVEDRPATHTASSQTLRLAEKAPERDRTNIRLTVNPAAPAGPFFETLALKTDRKDIPVIVIPISGEIAGELSLQPEELFLGIVRSPAVIERDIELVSSNPATKITAVSCTISRVKTAIQDGGRRIHLTLDPRESPGAVEGELTVKTTSAAKPEIKISIQGLIKLPAAQVSTR